MAHVVFFASIREELGINELNIDISDDMKLSQVVDTLSREGAGNWKSILMAENVRIAVNHELVNDDVQVNNGDEIAFFPPVTGG